MIKTKTWIILFSSLLILLLATVLFLYSAPKDDPVARIYIDGNCVQSIDLSAAEGGRFVIETEYGTNTVSIVNHKICVSEADCPHQICVNTGWIADGTMPIVCLPHHLVIKIESAKSSADAVTR